MYVCLLKRIKGETMNIEEYREYCLSVKGATECMPFDEHTLVFKVMDKMFTLRRYALKMEDSGLI